MRGSLLGAGEIDPGVRPHDRGRVFVKAVREFKRGGATRFRALRKENGAVSVRIPVAASDDVPRQARDRQTERKTWKKKNGAVLNTHLRGQHAEDGVEGVRRAADLRGVGDVTAAG